MSEVRSKATPAPMHVMNGGRGGEGRVFLLPAPESEVFYVDWLRVLECIGVVAFCVVLELALSR